MKCGEWLCRLFDVHRHLGENYFAFRVFCGTSGLCSGLIWEMEKCNSTTYDAYFFDKEKEREMNIFDENKISEQLRCISSTLSMLNILLSNDRLTKECK